MSWKTWKSFCCCVQQHPQCRMRWRQEGRLIVIWQWVCIHNIQIYTVQLVSPLWWGTWSQFALTFLFSFPVPYRPARWSYLQHPPMAPAFDVGSLPADMLHDVTAMLSCLELPGYQPALMSRAWDSKFLRRASRNWPQVGEIVQHYVYLPFFDGVGKGHIVRHAIWGWVEIGCSEKLIKIDRSTVLLSGPFRFKLSARNYVVWIWQEPSISVDL